MLPQQGPAASAALAFCARTFASTLCLPAASATLAFCVRTFAVILCLPAASAALVFCACTVASVPCLSFHFSRCGKVTVASRQAANTCAAQHYSVCSNFRDNRIITQSPSPMTGRVLPCRAYWRIALRTSWSPGLRTRTSRSSQVRHPTSPACRRCTQPLLPPGGIRI